MINVLVCFCWRTPEFGACKAKRLIPIIIDAATGNWYELDQDHLNAILETQQIEN